MRFRSLFRRDYYLYLATIVYVLFTCVVLLGVLRQYLLNAQAPPVSLERSSRIWNTDGRVYSLTYSPNGQILASVETLTRDTEHAEYVIRLRQVSTGKIIHTLSGQKQRFYALAFSHNGDMIAGGDQDSLIQLWRVADGVLLATLTGHTKSVQQVIFAPNDKALLSVSEDYSIREWSIPRGVAEATTPWSEYYNCGIANATFVGGKPRFVVREGSNVTVQSFPGQEILQAIHGFERGSCSDFEKIDVQFNQDATLLASIDALEGRKSSIRIWDLSTGRIRSTLNGHTDEIMSIAFSSDNQLLASASGIPYFAMYTNGDLSVRIWRISDENPIAIFENAHYGAIVGLAFSPDNRTLASGGVDGVIQFWQIPLELKPAS